MHPIPVCVCDIPSLDVSTRSDQRENGIAQRRHGPASRLTRVNAYEGVDVGGADGAVVHDSAIAKGDDAVDFVHK